MLYTHPVNKSLPTYSDITPIYDGEQCLNSEDHKTCSSLAGALSYLTICTRPDISLSVSVPARQLHTPAERNMVLDKRVVRYVTGTSDKTLFHLFNPNLSEPLTAHSDAHWAGCRESRKSTTGTVLKVNSGPIYWTSKRQSLVTLSSSEAEYFPLSSCGNRLYGYNSVSWRFIKMHL